LQNFRIDDPNYQLYSSFLFNYDADSDLGCFQIQTLSASDITSATLKISGSQVTYNDKDAYLFKRKTHIFRSSFQPSLLNGGQSSSFDLAQGIRTPKMCATRSAQVEPPVEYYTG